MNGSDSGAEETLTFDPGTREDREALFEYLVESTMDRDAFASLSEHPVVGDHPAGIDIVAEMEQYRDELIAADTGEEMWFVLRKISNVRRDRHLEVSPVEEGLSLPDSIPDEAEAPVQFAVDYADPNDRFFFVSDLAVDIENRVNGPTPSLGDRLRSVDDRSVQEFVAAVRPYKRYSTENAFWWMVGDEITRTWDTYYGHSHHLPPDEFYDGEPDTLQLGLERETGERYDIEVPYLDPDEIQWQGHSDREYPGFSPVEALDGYDTYRDVYLADDTPVVLLDWYGFQDDLPEAIDALMEYAETEGILDHHVIVDATRARGGSLGSYALQRLQSEPHRGTFGNMKVSDAMEEWVDQRIEEIRSGEADTSTVDDGSWQLEWLEEDVRNAIEADRLYTNDVPHKGSHAPKWSDGIIDPAPVHFKGDLTVWASPHGGSHLDQFSAQVVDNDVGYLIGMPPGGYSSTWEAEETLRFPTTNRPIVEYRWTMGFSIRPNKEMLQYNPAEPHEFVPQTRKNYFEYHSDLIDRTLDRLDIES